MNCNNKMKPKVQDDKQQAGECHRPWALEAQTEGLDENEGAKLKEIEEATIKRSKRSEEECEGDGPSCCGCD